MTDHPDTQPTQDARRQAVANALAWAPGLVRYAARYTHTIEDAEDAYQGAMEIALTRAPCVDRSDFVPWLHTVIRNEALRIRSRRSRECPTEIAEVDTHLEGAAQERATPDAVAEWRERYRWVQDGLLGLGERTRVCLMLRSAGMDRQEISDLLEITLRTVSREIHEGRSQLRAFEIRVASGEECERIGAIIDRALDREATPADLRKLDRHARNCPSCRESYRTARATGHLVASFVPAGLVGTDLMQARPADVSAIVGWWDRLSGAATVRTGNLMQAWLDIPQLMASKAGAGAVAAAAVGAIGAPMVVQTIRDDGAPPRGQQAAVVVPPSTPPAAVRREESRPSRAQTVSPARGTSAPTAPRVSQRPARSTRWRSQSGTSTSAPPARPVRTVVSDASVLRATSQPAGSAAAEFAP